MKLKTTLQLFFVTLSSLALVACSQSPSKNEVQKAKKQRETLIIKKSQQTTTLYFNGVVSPIDTHAVTSPIDGTVVALSFVYGQKVDKDHVLVLLKSSTLDKDYQTAVSTYLTAKEKYNTSKTNIVGAKDLYDSGITSRQTYESAKSSLNDAYLMYLQAEYSLVKLFNKTNLQEKSVYLLKIDDEAAVKKVLEATMKDIQVRANTTGVALLPTKAASRSDSADGKAIEVGSQVKAGQLLVSIGDMTGIKIRVSVGEVNINQVNVGDKASITSAGFPGVTLYGRVTGVSRQAKSDPGGGLPTFPVTVSVKKITPLQQKVVHVGMSAKVKVTIAAPEAITIPIKAVKVINNVPYVRLVDPKTGKISQHAVQTGATTISEVTIVKGLKSGDEIVFSH